MGPAISIATIRRDVRALGVSEGVADVIEQLIRHNAGRIELPGRAKRGPGSLGDVAALFLKLSLSRTEIVGSDLIHDAAWHMLLALFTDVERDRQTYVSSLLHASGSPPTTALRTLAVLEQQGMIQRYDDPRDARRIIIRPKGETMSRMADAIERFCVPPPENIARPALG